MDYDVMIHPVLFVTVGAAYRRLSRAAVKINVQQVSDMPWRMFPKKVVDTPHLMQV